MVHTWQITATTYHRTIYHLLSPHFVSAESPVSGTLTELPSHHLLRMSIAIHMRNSLDTISYCAESRRPETLRGRRPEIGKCISGKLLPPLATQPFTIYLQLSLHPSSPPGIRLRRVSSLWDSCIKRIRVAVRKELVVSSSCGRNRKRVRMAAAKQVRVSGTHLANYYHHLPPPYLLSQALDFRVDLVNVNQQFL